MKPTKEQVYEAILAAVDECPRGFSNNKNGQNRIDALGKQIYPDCDWNLPGGSTGPRLTELGPKGLRILKHVGERWFTESAFTPEVKKQILYRDKSLPAKLYDTDPALYADVTAFLLIAQAAPKITKEGVASMCGTLDADVDAAWRQISHFLTHGTLRQAVGEDSPMTWAVAGIENQSVNYARQHGFLEVRNTEVYEVPYVAQGMVGRKPSPEIIALHGKPVRYSELQRQAIALETRLLSYLAGVKL
jgi:hypothetical protein